MSEPNTTNQKIVRLVAAAKAARDEHWKPTSDESTGDKLAMRVTKAWQSIVIQTDSDFAAEVSVPQAKQKIDLVDGKAGIACEFKVSENNPEHEFFKDVFKVLLFNESAGERVSTFVFLTGTKGAGKLHRGLAGLIVPLLKREHALVVEIHGV